MKVGLFHGNILMTHGYSLKFLPSDKGIGAKGAQGRAIEPDITTSAYHKKQ